MFVDANVFIFATTDSTALGDRARRRLREPLHLRTSALVLDEFLWKTKAFDRTVIAQQLHHIRTHITTVPVPANAAFDAFELMQQHNLDPRDAIHVATMQAVGETEIMSTDQHFDRVPGIKRIAL